VKGCLSLVVLATAAAGGGCAVYANPTLPAEASRVVQQAASWVQTHTGG
jgi:hypothetical protein